MRRAAKVDANQPDIVAAFRSLLCTVEHLHSVGSGCPDIAVSWGGVTHFCEIKDGSLPPSRRRLTRDEADWHAATRATVHIVESIEDAQRVASMLRAQARKLEVLE